MPLARYTDLKKALYNNIKTYSELKEFVKKNLDITLECVKPGNILCRKNGTEITVTELNNMLKDFI